jgi:hypothetical protein
MEQLFLADLKNYSDEAVREHLINEYTVDSAILYEYDILIAYESVGSWGCDSSSFFLLRNRRTQALYEIHGSHCSCHGFEGQFKPEKTTLKYLNSDKFYFYCGGYDEDDEQHRKQVGEYLQRLLTNAREGD